MFPLSCGVLGNAAGGGGVLRGARPGPGAPGKASAVFPDAGRATCEGRSTTRRRRRLPAAPSAPSGPGGGAVAAGRRPSGPSAASPRPLRASSALLQAGPRLPRSPARPRRRHRCARARARSRPGHGEAPPGPRATARPPPAPGAGAGLGRRAPPRLAQPPPRRLAPARRRRPPAGYRLRGGRRGNGSSGAFYQLEQPGQVAAPFCPAGGTAAAKASCRQREAAPVLQRQHSLCSALRSATHGRPRGHPGRRQRDHSGLGRGQAEHQQPPPLQQQPGGVHRAQEGPLLPVLPGSLQRGQDQLHEAGRGPGGPAGLALRGGVPPHQLRPPEGRTQGVPRLRAGAAQAAGDHPAADHPQRPAEGRPLPHLLRPLPSPLTGWTSGGAGGRGPWGVDGVEGGERKGAGAGSARQALRASSHAGSSREGVSRPVGSPVNSARSSGGRPPFPGCVAPSHTRQRLHGPSFRSHRQEEGPP